VTKSSSHGTVCTFPIYPLGKELSAETDQKYRKLKAVLDLKFPEKAESKQL